MGTSEPASPLESMPDTSGETQNSTAKPDCSMHAPSVRRVSDYLDEEELSADRASLCVRFGRCLCALCHFMCVVICCLPIAIQGWLKGFIPEPSKFWQQCLSGRTEGNVIQTLIGRTATTLCVSCPSWCVWVCCLLCTILVLAAGHMKQQLKSCTRRGRFERGPLELDVLSQQSRLLPSDYAPLSDASESSIHSFRPQSTPESHSLFLCAFNFCFCLCCALFLGSFLSLGLAKSCSTWQKETAMSFRLHVPSLFWDAVCVGSDAS